MKYMKLVISAVKCQGVQFWQFLAPDCNCETQLMILVVNTTPLPPNMFPSSYTFPPHISRRKQFILMHKLFAFLLPPLAASKNNLVI